MRRTSAFYVARYIFGDALFRAHVLQLQTVLYSLLSMCGQKNSLCIQFYFGVDQGGPIIQGGVSDTGVFSEELAIQRFQQRN